MINQNPITNTKKMRETTTPTAIPGVGQFYTKSDNKPYFQDGAGNEVAMAQGTPAFGELKIIDNALEMEINADEEWQGLTSNVVTGAVENMTYSEGCTGLTIAVTDNSGTLAGTVIITSESDHNLSPGDMITQNGHTDSAYNGFFEVISTPLTDAYIITAVYTATDSGFFQRGSSLLVGALGAGRYKGTWDSTGIAETNGHDFDFVPVVNLTPAGAAKARRTFSNADYGSFGGTELPLLAVGDKISFAIQNVGASGNITIRTFDLNLHRL